MHNGQCSAKITLGQHIGCRGSYPSALDNVLPGQALVIWARPAPENLAADNIVTPLPSHFL